MGHSLFENIKFSASEEISRIYRIGTLMAAITRDIPCSYPEPDRSSPCSDSALSKNILILFSHLRLGLIDVPFPSGFSTKTPYTSILSPYSLHALFDFIDRTIRAEE
jgi:hypothetical protein